MSHELAIETPHGIIMKIRQALFGSPQKPQKYAHPWTAYSPANFQPKTAAKTIPEMNVASRRSVTTSVTKLVRCTATDMIAKPRPAEVIKLVEVSPRTNKREAEPACCLPPPVALKLIENHKIEEPAAIFPALAAATGQDFQLAARLRSVSVLNRVAIAPAVKQATKRSGLNRPITPVAVNNRRRQIEPPAVRRMKRMSAEVIQLKMALARSELKQARARRAA